MTTVAWDGKRLAVDRQGTSHDMRASCIKISIVRMHMVNWHGALPGFAAVAMMGKDYHACRIMRWLEAGAVEKDFPVAASKDEEGSLIVALDGCVYVLTTAEPVMQPRDTAFMAWGSGRDFAMGAMAHGADAIAAIETAARFDIWTQGCEYVNLSELGQDCCKVHRRPDRMMDWPTLKREEDRAILSMKSFP